ncbi:MAG: ATP synthase F0 subunit B [Rikenellaceae bacterium]|nr:ATP synthase F0 subunit B [Rikenellaceae bacterium]MCL2693234.1 ATP synthase F0 subunit B [Rikenellaceae bacterium]
MSSLLTPDFGLLFWMLLSFGAVFFALSRWAFPVIKRTVAKRSDYIESSLASADEARRKAQDAESLSKTITDEARVQQAEILKKAMSDGENIVHSAHERAAAERDKLIAALHDDLEHQREKAMVELSGEMTDMVLDLTERVLRERLEDPQRQHELVLRMLEEAEHTRVFSGLPDTHSVSPSLPDNKI